jgi:hypothetical protein
LTIDSGTGALRRLSSGTSSEQFYFVAKPSGEFVFGKATLGKA